MSNKLLPGTKIRVLLPEDDPRKVEVRFTERDDPDVVTVYVTVEDPDAPDPSVPRVGGYWMMGTRPVHITRQRFDSEKCFGVTYVQIDPSGRVSDGGTSYWWGPEDFTWITDSYIRAACQVFEARRRQKEYEALLSESKDNETKWAAVMELVKDTPTPEETTKLRAELKRARIVLYELVHQSHPPVGPDTNDLALRHRQAVAEAVEFLGEDAGLFTRCFHAKCQNFAMKGSALCMEHYEALPDNMKPDEDRRGE